MRKGEESLDDMITQLQQLQVGGIRRLPKGCDVETRKQQKRVLTQYGMGKKLNTTNSKGSQTLSGFSTNVDPSVIPYRWENDIVEMLQENKIVKFSFELISIEY